MKVIPAAIQLIVLLVALASAPGCDRFGHSAEPPSGCLELSELERRTKVEEDLALIRRYDEGLTRTLEYARANPRFFPRDETQPLSPEQKRELRAIFQATLDYMRALDGIKSYWKDFHKFGVIKQRRAHAEAFFVGYSAWLVQYRHGLEFIDLTVPSKPMEKLLDEGSSEFDIPPGAFEQLKWNVIHVKAIARLMGSQQYFKTVEPALADADCNAKPLCANALTHVAVHSSSAMHKLQGRAAIQFSYNAFDIARDFTFDRWFPVQKNVAAWMGDTKVRRLHKHLIKKTDLDLIATSLQPGDILVTRQNWYLSNVGLPGFWPHALLWVGPPEKLDAFFDDEETRRVLNDIYGSTSLSSVLQNRAGKAWLAYTQRPDDQPHTLVEAISEGVVFSTLIGGAKADYLAAMRPNRSRAEKALAVVRAFERFGKPYDFNFDFTTDESLVCTELVYKAWQPNENTRGVAFDLVNVMGRKTLPANELVRQFDAHFDQPERPLDFVYFLDGREKEGYAVHRDAEAFRSSWRRPKWDVLQE